MLGNGADEEVHTELMVFSVDRAHCAMRPSRGAASGATSTDAAGRESGREGAVAGGEAARPSCSNACTAGTAPGALALLACDGCTCGGIAIGGPLRSTGERGARAALGDGGECVGECTWGGSARGAELVICIMAAAIACCAAYAASAMAGWKGYGGTGMCTEGLYGGAVTAEGGSIIGMGPMGLIGLM